MPFWSSQTLKARIPTEQLVVPYADDGVVHAAYEMRVGPEAFVTSDTGETTELPEGNKIVIPPGQFGLLVTQETVRIPANVIAFISIRAGIKFQGLINVSGFHVDPGYHGQLRFAVYNAGSQNIVLDQGQPVFMIWLADLDDTDTDPYPEQENSGSVITAGHVAAIQGDVASPAELKTQLDDLKLELDKKFHATEQTRLFNRGLLMLAIGIGVTIALAIFKPYIVPSPQDGMSGSVPAEATSTPEVEEPENQDAGSPEL